MSYQTSGFAGTVVLKEWFHDPLTCRALRGVSGKVSIIEGKEMIGFDPGKNEANWVARVEGVTGAYNFPGCQVRAVVAHTAPIARNAEYRDLDQALDA